MSYESQEIGYLKERVSKLEEQVAELLSAKAPTPPQQDPPAGVAVPIA